MTNIQQLLQFISFAEKLKTELRHSYTSDSSRKESVAEHTWMMSLLAILLQREISLKVDMEKVLKMIIVHDLVEVFAGDIPAFEKSERATAKQKNEIMAIDKLMSYLPNIDLASELRALWTEFETGETNEAKFAQSLDKLEVLIQHNIANIKTFEQGDFDLNPYYKNDKFDFDSFMRAFKDQVDVDTMTKIENAGLLHKVSKPHQERWKKDKHKN